MKLLPGLVALQPGPEHQLGKPTLGLEAPTHMMATVPHTVAAEEALEEAVLQPGHPVLEPPMTHLLALADRQAPVSMHLRLVPELLRLEPSVVLAPQPLGTALPLPRRHHTTTTEVQIINVATMLLPLVADTLLPHQAPVATPQLPVRQFQHQVPGPTVLPPLVLPTLQLPVHQDIRARELPELAPMMLLLLPLCLLVKRCTTHPLLLLWEVCLLPPVRGHMGLTETEMMADRDMKKVLQVLETLTKRVKSFFHDRGQRAWRDRSCYGKSIRAVRKRFLKNKKG